LQARRHRRGQARAAAAPVGLIQRRPHGVLERLLHLCPTGKAPSSAEIVRREGGVVGVADTQQFGWGVCVVFEMRVPS